MVRGLSWLLLSQVSALIWSITLFIFPEPRSEDFPFGQKAYGATVYLSRGSQAFNSFNDQFIAKHNLKLFFFKNLPLSELPLY